MLGAAALVPMSERLDQRHVQLDQSPPGALVPTVSVRAQQPAGGRISVDVDSLRQGSALQGGVQRIANSP